MVQGEQDVEELKAHSESDPHRPTPDSSYDGELDEARSKVLSHWTQQHSDLVEDAREKEQHPIMAKVYMARRSETR